MNIRKMQTAMKKKSLEDSLRGHSAQVEESKEIQHSGVFADAVREYKDFMDFMFKEWYPNRRKKRFADLSEDERYYRIHPVETVLNPQETDAFLSMLKNTENNLGTSLIFWRSLVQKSFDSGYNDFDMSNVDRLKIVYVGRFLSGQKDNPLIIRSKCSLGSSFGSETKNVEFYVDGNVENSCGWGSYKSKFFIKGCADENFGSFCNDCYFDVGDLNATQLGLESKRSTYRIGNLVDNTECYNVGLRSSNCTFISPSEAVIKLIAENFKGVGENRFYHELKDGSLVRVSK